VMVTHDSHVAERARRFITLHDGCIVEDDSYPKQVSALRLVAVERRQ
jgi:ABC-type lipoprotein export system ATPase subunit